MLSWPASGYVANEARKLPTKSTASCSTMTSTSPAWDRFLDHRRQLDRIAFWTKLRHRLNALNDPIDATQRGTILTAAGSTRRTRACSPDVGGMLTELPRTIPGAAASNSSPF